MPIIECPFPDCPYSTGDVTNELAVTLLNIHSNGTHSSHSSAPSAPSMAVEKVRRPMITSGGSSEKWSYFLIRWQDYVDATKVTGKDKIIQLLECCDEELRKDLTRSSGGSLTSKTEEEVLSAIKKLAVREENTMVARVALYEMRQDREEGIRAFGARIKGQAGICKYLMKCTSCQHQNDYTDEILKDVIIRGIADPEIQLDLLSDRNQEMTLEEVLNFIEIKESGKRSATRLLETQGVDMAKSHYKKQDQETMKQKAQASNTRCTYCGQQGHGKNSPASMRKNVCPAYSKSCSFCHRLHHFESVCRIKGKNSLASTPGDTHLSEGANFSSLCSTSEVKNFKSRSMTLEHHTYDNLSDCWTRQKSKPQPFITLKVTSHQDDYKEFGIHLNFQPKACSIPAMADTGCQSCLISLKLLSRLSFSERDLIPVTMKMHAANDNKIKIIGAVILRISGTSSHGEHIETRQITYVTPDSDKFFLSKEACIKLGMITNLFPEIGEVKNVELGSEVTITEEPHTGSQSNISNCCDCPKRQLPPPKPKHLPYTPNEENREKLKQWLINYYKYSTFNTCEHQPLPKMGGPPLRLMIDPQCHTSCLSYSSPSTTALARRCKSWIGSRCTPRCH